MGWLVTRSARSRLRVALVGSIAFATPYLNPGSSPAAVNTAKATKTKPKVKPATTRPSASKPPVNASTTATAAAPKSNLEFQQAVERARAETSRDALADATLALAQAQIIAGAPKDALVSIEEVIALRYSAPKDDSRMGDALFDKGWAILVAGEARATALARAELDQKNYKEAGLAQARVVELARAQKASSPLPDLLDSYGVIQIMSEIAPRAVLTLTEAVGLREGPDSAPLAASLHLLGWAYLKSERGTDATAMLQRVIGMRDRLGLTADADLSRTFLAAVK